MGREGGKRRIRRGEMQAGPAILRYVILPSKEKGERESSLLASFPAANLRR